jgi:hypothetical protein
VDQAHEQVPDLSPILVFVEQCVLAMKNDFLERPLANVVVQGCSGNGDIVLLLVKTLKTLAG